MPRFLLFQRIDLRCELIIEQGLFQVSLSLTNPLSSLPSLPPHLKMVFVCIRKWYCWCLNVDWLLTQQPAAAWGTDRHWNGFKTPGDSQTRTEPLPTLSRYGVYLQYNVAEKIFLFCYFLRFHLKSWTNHFKHSFETTKPRQGLILKLSFLQISYCRSPRLLAQNQLTWHRKGDRFQWVNMAPGDQKLEMKEVAERVSQWLENETPLPPEWDGTPLMKLVCI